MAKRISKPTYIWEAETELELQNLAVACQYDEVKRGNRTVRVLRIPAMKEDGNIYFDVGKRLRGWMKEQVKTIKPSALDYIQYGLYCQTLPTVGEMKIATKKDLIGDKQFPESQKINYELPDGLEYPFMDIIITDGGKSVYSQYYIMEKPMKLKAKISCFGRNITPESIEGLLQKLGRIKGLGDKHSTGIYGLFTLKHFKAKTELLNF